MTMATRAPVIVASSATPKRMSSQFTIRPPGEADEGGIADAEHVESPQLNESKTT